MKKSTIIYAVCALSNLGLVLLQEELGGKALFLSAFVMFAACAILDIRNQKEDE